MMMRDSHLSVVSCAYRPQNTAALEVDNVSSRVLFQSILTHQQNSIIYVQAINPVYVWRMCFVCTQMCVLKLVLVIIRISKI